jgi:hypothetical protein
VREVAQLGAVIGREFAFEMLHALSVIDEKQLQQGLAKLIDSELIYQRGQLPLAKYVFKHALVQDAAYQSMLRRTRQRYHQRCAEVFKPSPSWWHTTTPKQGVRRKALFTGSGRANGPHSAWHITKPLRT